MTAADYLRYQQPLPNLAGQYPNLPTSLGPSYPTNLDALKWAPNAVPSGMPAAPNFTTIDPGERPDQSNYNWYTQMLESTALKPMSEEEQERRTRAAYSSAAVGALGNALSAFSNLAFTGGVAPSQKLPDVYNPHKEVEAMKNREQNRMDRYIQQRMAARQADTQDYNTAFNRWLQAVNANNANAMQKYNIDWNRFQHQYNDKKYREQFDYKKEQDAITNKRADRHLDMQDRHQRNQTALGWANYNRQVENDKVNRYVKLMTANAKVNGGSGKGGSSIAPLRLFVPGANGNAYLTDNVQVDMGKLFSDGSFITQLTEEISDMAENDTELRSAISNLTMATTKAQIEKAREELIGLWAAKDSTGQAYQILDDNGFIVHGGSTMTNKSNDNIPPSRRQNNDNIPPSRRK